MPLVSSAHKTFTSCDLTMRPGRPVVCRQTCVCVCVGDVCNRPSVRLALALALALAGSLRPFASFHHKEIEAASMASAKRRTCRRPDRVAARPPELWPERFRSPSKAFGRDKLAAGYPRGCVIYAAHGARHSAALRVALFWHLDRTFALPSLALWSSLIRRRGPRAQPAPRSPCCSDCNLN